MADKGVINHRKASVTFTVEMDGKQRDIVLKPGANRLSAAQRDALGKNKIFRALFKVSEAVEVTAIPDPENPGEMKRQTIKKKLPPKFREASPDELDATEAATVDEDPPSDESTKAVAVKK